MNYKNIITIILFSLFFALAFYFNWIIWMLSFAVSIWFYTIIFYVIHIIWKKIRKKEITEFVQFFKNFLYRIWLFIFITFWILAGIAITINEFFPAKMPEYTLTNWEKTVKFQAMIHIWAQEYYDKIIDNLRDFKQDWWVYFYEWVRPWSEENMKEFDKALWINFDANLYPNVSRLYWVTFQNTNDFLWIENELDFNVDLSIDEIIEIYNKNQSNQQQEEQTREPIDANTQILETLAWLNQRQLNVLVYVNQAIMNLIIGNPDIQSSMTKAIWAEDIFDVIIDERDEYLAQEVQNSEREKIFITYWLLHFEWFFEELKKLDPSWEITKTKYLYPIQ